MTCPGLVNFFMTYVASLSKSELGTAQPQLVSLKSHILLNFGNFYPQVIKSRGSNMDPLMVSRDGL